MGLWIAGLFAFGTPYLACAAVAVGLLAYCSGNSPVWYRWARTYVVCAVQCVFGAFWYVAKMTMQAGSAWEQGLACFLGAVGAVLATVIAVALVDLVSFLGRKEFPVREAVLAQPPLEVWPGVCFQLPAYDEPPEMVIDTIVQLLKQDYPGQWMIQVIDNNTPDPATWQPVHDFCANFSGRIQFMHLENWPGFKAGALNEGIRRMPGWVDHVAIVDADYLVDPQFLRTATVQLRDGRVAFVQTPQNYRGWETSKFLQSLYFNYEEYYQTRKPSRGEVNGIICVGTMAVIRKTAIEEVGLWDETSCTEDAEVSVRLLSRGWRGVFDHRVRGQGIMPLDFSGLCKQRFRWALGMIHIFRKHKHVLLAAPAGERRLTWPQRLSFWGLANQYLTELIPVASLCLFATGAFIFGKFGRNAVVDVCLYLPSLALGGYLWMTTARMLVAARSSMSRFPVVGAMVVAFSLSWVTAWACLCGFASRKVVFLRTPKTLDSLGWFSAVRSARLEATFSIVAIVLSVWLSSHHFMVPAAAAAALGAVFGSAPAVALAYICYDAASIASAASDPGAAQAPATERSVRGETNVHPFTELKTAEMSETANAKSTQSAA